MKKKCTNAVIKILAITIMTVAVNLTPAFCQEPAIDNDLITYSMAVSPDQKVKFRVPLDIRSGDMITGTVIEEKKSTKGEVNNASSTLEGVVIEIDGKQTKLSNRIISFLVPAGLTSLPFLLKNPAGQVIDQGQIPIGVYSYFDPMWWPEPVGGLGYKFSPEVLGQPGQPLTISGNFDGNASNTNVSLGGQNCDVIAESNRMSIVQVQQNTTAGVANLTVEENNIKEEHKINIATLNLSTNKTTLRKGQKATVTVTVSGLQGMKTGNDCKVEITNLSPSIVRFNNEVSNNISYTIPQGLTADYNFTFNIVGLTPGSFILEGRLMPLPDIGNLLDRIKKGIQGTGSPYFYRNSSDLELLLKELNKRKDYDYSQNGGKPGPDAEWLWGEIKKIMDILSVRGYKFNEDGTMTRPDGTTVQVR